MRNYTIFGAEARGVMLKKDIKMSKMASDIGISTSYISYLFKGDKKSDKWQAEIAKYLGMKKWIKNEV